MGRKLWHEVLDPAIEAHLRARRPAIVINSCDGGRQGWALNGIGGWAERFVGSEAGLLLAAQWSISNRQALRFAQTVYAEMAGGAAAAPAVRRARLADRAEGDPTWLAYTLYGHPLGRVV